MVKIYAACRTLAKYPLLAAHLLILSYPVHFENLESNQCFLKAPASISSHFDLGYKPSVRCSQNLGRNTVTFIDQMLQLIS